MHPHFYWLSGWGPTSNQNVHESFNMNYIAIQLRKNFIKKLKVTNFGKKLFLHLTLIDIYSFFGSTVSNRRFAVRAFNSIREKKSQPNSTKWFLGLRSISSYRVDHSYTIYRCVPNTPRHLAGGFVDQRRNENLFAAKQPGKRRKTETFSFLFPIPLTALSQMKSRSSV